MQSKAASYAAMLSALEAELGNTRGALSEVKAAVAENRSLGDTPCDAACICIELC